MTYRAIEWSLAALALAGCVEKHAFVADDGPLPVPPGTTGVSVARLLSEYRGYPSEVKDDWQLDVVVTANDRFGSFRNALWVRDSTGGIQIKVSGDELFLDFPVGQPLRVRCQGLVLGDYAGEVSLGATSDDPAYPNGFIARDDRTYLSETLRRTRRGVARYGDFCRARRPAFRLVSRFRARAVRRRGAFARVVRSGRRHEQASGRLPGRHARRANVLPGRFRVSAAACRQRLRRGYSEPVQSDLSTKSLYGPERRHGFAEVRAGFPVRSRPGRSVTTRSPFRNGFARDRRELPRRSRQAMAEVSCERP